MSYIILIWDVYKIDKDIEHFAFWRPRFVAFRMDRNRWMATRRCKSGIRHVELWSYPFHPITQIFILLEDGIIKLQNVVHDTDTGS